MKNKTQAKYTGNPDTKLFTELSLNGIIGLRTQLACRIKESHCVEKVGETYY